MSFFSFDLQENDDWLSWEQVIKYIASLSEWKQAAILYFYLFNNNNNGVIGRR